MLHNCQLEKLIACLYGPGKQGKAKIKNLQLPIGNTVIQRTKEMNEINLTLHFTKKILIQFVYQGSF